MTKNRRDRNENVVRKRVSNIGQFEVVVRENRIVIEHRIRDDPWIQTTIVPKGLKAAWMVLRGKLILRVNVFGTRAAANVILSGNYREPEKEKKEEEYD